MALFQKNVLARYVAMQDAQQIDAAYEQFAQYFHDVERQQNILSSKEEQFQEGFLRELFVKILGYTLNPDPAFNLITEKKDVNDSKKADGAILLGGEVIGIIELKDHKTPDLSKVEHQAFGYKNQHPKARYVVISNFQKLRFYIDNAVEHIEWNLFDLSRDEFAQLWVCLHYDNLSRHLAATVKNESLSSEEQITNKLYKDYIAFKRVLFEDILRRNTTDEGERSTAEWKILLFKKTQKLLDRLLFIFFAEDSGLLPPNSMREIITQWRQLVEDLDEDVRLYSRIKKYFGYMNDGHKGKKYDIFAYNGGLFKPDEVLDSLDIDDNLLAEHTLRLSEYDFASEVDVNILGHIFENSLSEIEEVTAQLQNGEAPTVSKRKKDGVFYTPQYITRYIVDNTLGKLCREKRDAMGLVEEEYYEAQTRQLKTKQRMLERLTEYRDWLLGLTICDPACGSGAFLNAALQFLMAEHKSLDKMEAALTGSSIEFPNVENSILENNLYGVDINEESVEIARLALWLRTAKPFRKLTSLNGNIKCGNSLISDPEIAGEKAFDWQKEFPQVFEKGGFDVVIGNPPYLRVQGMRENHEAEAKFYEVNYKSATERFDYYVLFMERGFSLINEKGLLSFILPHKFINASFGVGIRSFIYEKKALNSLIHFGAEQVFDSASVYTCIITLSKNNTEFNYAQIKPSDLSSRFETSTLSIMQICDCKKWILQAEETNTIFDKINKCSLKLRDIYVSCSQGVVSMGDDIYMMRGHIDGDVFVGFSKELNQEIRIESDIVRPVLKGEDVRRYCTAQNQYYIIYPHYQKDGKTLPYTEEELAAKFPLCYRYLLPYRELLIEKKIRYKTNPTFWYSLHRAREISMFEPRKIITQEISHGCNMTIDENSLYHCTTVYTIILKKEFNDKQNAYLAILNSPLMWYFLSNTGCTLRGGYFRFKTKYVDSFPIPSLDKDSASVLADLAGRMLSLNAELQRLRARFVRRLQENLGLETVSASLQEFDTLTYADFVRELKKQKIKLTLSQQDEWEDYFAERAAACAAIRADIATTDADINARVYTLYGLTEDEIKIVEG